MKPKYFCVTAWDMEPRARCDEPRFSVYDGVPGDYRGFLSFHLADGGRAWHDVLSTGRGILLFSEKVVNAFCEGSITGMTFYEAGFSRIENARLAKKERPKYFWARAEGLIDFDHKLYRDDGRFVPTAVRPPQGVDVFHLNYPKSPASYACVMRVIETFRKHKVRNLLITALDYYQVNKMDCFTPPFRIDVLARQWPPAAWYPEGFVPHPNNLVEE